MRGFREFILRGNLVDLAVAVVIGAAFGAVASALVRDLITPLIAAIGGNPDFGVLSFTINGSRFAYGNFLNALLSFLIVAAIVYFLVLKPVGLLLERLPQAGGRAAALVPRVPVGHPGRRAALRVLHGRGRRRVSSLEGGDRHQPPGGSAQAHVGGEEARVERFREHDITRVICRAAVA